MHRLLAPILVLCTVSAFSGNAVAGKLNAVDNAQPTSKQQQHDTVCPHPGYGPCSQRGMCHPTQGPNGQFILKCED